MILLSKHYHTFTISCLRVLYLLCTAAVCIIGTSDQYCWLAEACKVFLLSSSSKFLALSLNRYGLLSSMGLQSPTFICYGVVNSDSYRRHADALLVLRNHIDMRRTSSITTTTLVTNNVQFMQHNCWITPQPHQHCSGSELEVSAQTSANWLKSTSFRMHSVWLIDAAALAA